MKRIKNMRKLTKNLRKPINKTRFLNFLKKAATDQKYEETNQKFEETDPQIEIFKVFEKKRKRIKNMRKRT